MKFRIVFGLILLILVFIGFFVGLPYFLRKIQLSPIFEFPKFTFMSAPALSTSTPGFWNFFSPAQVQSRRQSIVQSGNSIFQNKINIAGVSKYGRESVNLSNASPSLVNITGWRIKSRNRGEFVIGKGLALPNFSSDLSDVWLSAGESAEIIADISPLANNFRINSCFGGISELYNLGYGFSCPAIAPMDFAGMDSACQDLIMRSSSCRAPSDNILNQQSSKCRTWFEKNVNYPACVSKHINDRNFYGGWKIFTGNKMKIFDPLHDKIELRDRAGLAVDSYEY